MNERDPNTSAPPATAESPRRAWPIRLWQRYVIDGLAEEETTSRDHIEGRPMRAIDWKVVGVLVVSVVGLILLEYLGKNQYYWQYVHPRDVGEAALDHLRRGYMEGRFETPYTWLEVDAFRQPPSQPAASELQLWQLLYWAGWCVVAYFLLPVLFIKFVLRERLRDYGLRVRGTLKHWWVYALMFAVVLPLVIIVSNEPSFQQQYPFYRFGATDPQGLVLWELAYAAQFFSLEFFFRGFMINGLKHRLGAYAVLVSMIPYVMIHFGKPMSETFGAIIAGIVLGVLALRTGSIMLGFLIHVSVALAMDIASLWKQDQLGLLLEGLFG